MQAKALSQYLRRYFCLPFQFFDLIVLFGAVMMLGCHEGEIVKKRADPDTTKIVGKWRCPPEGWLDSEIGPMQIKMDLQSSGKISVKWVIRQHAPGGDGEQSAEGVYQVDKSGLLTTQVIGRGDPIKYELKDDHLIMTLPQEADEPVEVYDFVRDE